MDYQKKILGWEGNKFVYSWQGNETKAELNWWIIKISVAWVSGLDENKLPSIE